MTKRNYKEEAHNLAEAAKIAIEVIKNYPPPMWGNESVTHVVNCYLMNIENALNPEPKYANLRSLKYVHEEIFTPFQEGHGKYVDVFWQKIKENNLPYERINRLEKILKRGKINNRTEFDYVIDTMIPFYQEGVISELELTELKKYVSAFEQKQSRK